MTARKKWMFRILLMGSPLILLGGVEAALRLGGYGFDTRFWIPSQERPGFLRENPQFGRRFFPPAMNRAPLPLLVNPVKPPNTVRIVVLGESAARGEPEPGFGLSRVLEALLEDQFPDREFEVINTAVTAINTHALLPIALECRQLQADFWLLYAGNNEVIGPFGPGTVFGRHSSNLPLLRLSLAAKRLRVVQWISETWTALRRGPPKDSWEGLAMFQENTLHSEDPRLNGVHRCFKQNVESMLAAARECGAVPVVCTVGVNLRDSGPFASQNRPGMSAADAAQFHQEIANARAALATRDIMKTAQAFERAAEIDDSHAELAFQRARLMLSQGQAPEASRLFQQACDLDALRFRASARQNEILRKAAADGGGSVLLADSASALAAASTNGIPGNDLFLEYVHLNFEGNYSVALEAARVIAGRLAPQGPPSEWLPPASVQLRLGFTDTRWLEVLQNIRARLKEPPFNTQSTWVERDRELRDEIARLLAVVRRPGQAEVEKAIFTAALQRAPNDWMLHDLHARSLATYNETSAASNHWTRVIAIMPHYYQAWFRLGASLNKPSTASAAEPYLRQAVKLRPDVPEGFRELGVCLGQQKRLAEAEGALAEALRLRPASAETELIWGSLLASQNQPDRALSHYRAAVRHSPSNLTARVSLSQLLMGRGLHSEAVGYLQPLVREHPENIPIRLLLLDALHGSGDAAAALAAAASAVEANPRSLEARNRLALEFIKRKRWKDAEVQFAEMIAQRPGDPALHFNLAKACADQSRVQEAETHLREALRLEPGHAPSAQLMEKLRAAGSNK